MDIPNGMKPLNSSHGAKSRITHNRFIAFEEGLSSDGIASSLEQLCFGVQF